MELSDSTIILRMRFVLGLALSNVGRVALTDSFQVMLRVRK